MGAPRVTRNRQFPEEFWLQAYILNREPTVPTNEKTQQLCFRHRASDLRARIGEQEVRAIALELQCGAVFPGSETGEPVGRYGLRRRRFYAIKRFNRNLSDPGTAAMLRLGPQQHRTKACKTADWLE